MRYQVDFTDARNGATSPIDIITGPDGYTAQDYLRDCEENADPEWCETLSHGSVTLIPVED